MNEINAQDKFDNIFDEILNKIDNDEELTRQDFYELIEMEIFTNVIGKKRWCTDIESICAIKDRYFYLRYSEGLTEYQEDEFPYQPIEVFPQKEKIEFIKKSSLSYNDKNGKTLFTNVRYIE